MTLLSRRPVAGACSRPSRYSPLDPTQTYIVTANNFIADGQDNFVTFREVDPATRIGGGIDLDELISYLGSDLAPIAPPGTDRANELP